MTHVTPVILCGGSGSRLWPLSRSGFPKQFLELSGDSSQQSLFQQALVRINTSVTSNALLGKSLIVTNEDHRFLVLDQLQGLANIQATLLLEPVGRNTAPALSLAALSAVSEGVDPILVVAPADQTIKNTDAFTRALRNSIALVEGDTSKQTIAILGITPTCPKTGYGYIERGGEIGEYGEFSIKQFVEKPNLSQATRYLAEGGYFWNSGMFVLRASTWLTALKEFRPDISIAVEKSWQMRKQDFAEQTQFLRPDREEFELCPSESIDYAVIEKCSDSKHFSIKMVELDAGWSDLGAWDAVWQTANQDLNGNAISGDVLALNMKDSLVHASSRLVGAIGVNNLVIVETADAVLVADRDQSQDVKAIVAQLEGQNRQEKNLHRKVARPWGWYDSVDEGDRFKVKRIQVKPGASLSLQMHHHRAEHWIVVKGVANITNGDQQITLSENQSTYIPQGQLHRLSNPGPSPLEIIEVQSGSYLGEDDIERFDDVYGRS